MQAVFGSGPDDTEKGTGNYKDPGARHCTKFWILVVSKDGHSNPSQSLFSFAMWLCLSSHLKVEPFACLLETGLAL